MGPEALARRANDEMLDQCGWAVQHFKSMNIQAEIGIGVYQKNMKSGNHIYYIQVFIS